MLSSVVAVAVVVVVIVVAIGVRWNGRRSSRRRVVRTGVLVDIRRGVGRGRGFRRFLEEDDQLVRLIDRI